MIGKIRKYQDSWVTKGILFLTALSFMSLFGISGYVGSVGKNKPVIKVDNLELLQGEFESDYNKQLASMKGMLGDNINENIKSMIIQQVISKKLTDMIVERTADKFNVSISDKLLKDTIQSRAEFMDDYGRFNLTKMKRNLAFYGINEADYLEQLRLEIERQHIIYGNLEHFEIPAIMAKYLAEAQNAKRLFKYVKIETDKVKVDREISNEELEQYYQDFISEFTNPETRDVKFVFIKNDDIAKQFTPTKEDMDTYYKEHIEKFEKPEERHVLQMAFESKDVAEKAMEALNKGDDFFKVASTLANQTNDETDFGLVNKDMLIEEIGDAAFTAKINTVNGPISSDLGWHIFKVTEIKPMTKMDSKKANEQILVELRNEKSYEVFQQLMKDIEDKIGVGATLEEIAKDLNTDIHSVIALKEDGTAKTFKKDYSKIIADKSFIEVVFSYNQGEITQVIELDEGIALPHVEKINEANPKPILEVKKDIEKIWTENEKAAIAQEIADNIVHDLEGDDNIESVASRLGLKLLKTEAIKRNENFEGLSNMSMLELFQEAYGFPKYIDLGNTKLIVVAEKVKSADKITDKEIRVTKNNLKLGIMREYSNYLIDSFARDYKIEINLEK